MTGAGGDVGGQGVAVTGGVETVGVAPADTLPSTAPVTRKEEDEEKEEEEPQPQQQHEEEEEEEEEAGAAAAAADVAAAHAAQQRQAQADQRADIEDELQRLELSVTHLREELQEAIQSERYEQCPGLRDAIAALAQRRAELDAALAGLQ